jgi:formylglycine-generating enzyme required for sulfatase activity
VQLPKLEATVLGLGGRTGQQPQRERRPSRAMTPRRAALAVLAGLAVACHAQRPASGTASPPRIVSDSIPGTLVVFDMVRVPGDAAAGIRPFLIGRTELLWDAYDAYMMSRPDSVERKARNDAVARPSRPYGAPDYGWGHRGFPTISVAREAAEAFCAWLSRRTGRRYRLATDVEWRHAARLATPATGARAAWLDSVAWHAGNSGATTHAAATRAPDALGLHDLFGNAAEWVLTADGRRVILGGSFRDPIAAVGPAAEARQDESWTERDPQIPKSRWWMSDGPFVGFRIVREIP